MIGNSTNSINTSRACSAEPVPNNLRVLIPVVLLLLVTTVWAYWPIITDLYKEWQRNDDYSAGQLVPLTALFLVWHEKKA